MSYKQKPFRGRKNIGLTFEEIFGHNLPTDCADQSCHHNAEFRELLIKTVKMEFEIFSQAPMTLACHRIFQMQKCLFLIKKFGEILPLILSSSALHREQSVGYEQNYPKATTMASAVLQSAVL